MHRKSTYNYQLLCHVHLTDGKSPNGGNTGRPKQQVVGTSSMFETFWFASLFFSWWIWSKCMYMREKDGYGHQKVPNKVFRFIGFIFDSI